jgi:hypothetical protein
MSKHERSSGTWHRQILSWLGRRELDKADGHEPWLVHPGQVPDVGVDVGCGRWVRQPAGYSRGPGTRGRHANAGRRGSGTRGRHANAGRRGSGTRGRHAKAGFLRLEHVPATRRRVSTGRETLLARRTRVRTSRDRLSSREHPSDISPDPCPPGEQASAPQETSLRVTDRRLRCRKPAFA